MKKELKYMSIEYTKSDEKYIDEFDTYSEKVSQEIVDFLGINHLDSKVNVTLWNY